MKGSVKMAVMARYKEDGRRTDHPDMNYPRMDYTPYSEHPEREWETTNANYGDTEARFRDRQGREHYDNGRFAPKDNADTYDPESRRYRRDDAGRFRSEYPYTPLVPPVYRGDDMNRIGFALEPGREIEHDYRMDANYPRMDEMGHRTSKTSMGHATGGGMELTREMAEEWMAGLKNEDGTKGPHWTLEQVKQVMAQRGVECDPIRLWVAMNAEYSDRVAVNKKHNVNTIDFYLDSAIAYWLKDKDAVDDKEAAYFMHVVKH